MVLASPGPLLTPPPSSSPPKTPIRSYSAKTPPRNGHPTPPPPGGRFGHEFIKLMIISLSLTQTHDRETPKQLMIYDELMIGPVRDHHAHSIYPPPRRSTPEITRRPWHVCSCLAPTASTHRTVHLFLLHALVPL